MEGDTTKFNPPPYSPNSETQIMPAVTPPIVPSVVVPTQSVNTVVIKNTPDPLTTTHFGPKPQIANCPYCHIQGKTTMETKFLKKAHYWALGLFLIGFWPCICCPYKYFNCSQKLHYCGNCNAFLGTCEP